MGTILFTSRFDLGTQRVCTDLILNDVGILYEFLEICKKHYPHHRIFIWFDPWIDADFQVRSALIFNSSVYLFGSAKNNDR